MCACILKTMSKTSTVTKSSIAQNCTLALLISVRYAIICIAICFDVTWKLVSIYISFGFEGFKHTFFNASNPSQLKVIFIQIRFKSSIDTFYGSNQIHMVYRTFFMGPQHLTFMAKQNRNHENYLFAHGRNHLNVEICLYEAAWLNCIIRCVFAAACQKKSFNKTISALGFFFFGKMTKYCENDRYM